MPSPVRSVRAALLLFALSSCLTAISAGCSSDDTSPGGDTADGSAPPGDASRDTGRDSPSDDPDTGPRDASLDADAADARVDDAGADAEAGSDDIGDASVDASDPDAGDAEVDPGGENGAGCDDDGDCSSGFCVGGVCCATACPDEGAASCGTNGVCTGGTCQTYDATTLCGPAACANGAVSAGRYASATLTGASACNGAGTCVPSVTSNACAGNFICADATSCKTSCAADTDCVAGTYCDSTNACVRLLADGATCTSSTQCYSHVCNAGKCVACATGVDCNPGQAACDATNNCEQCTTTADCTSGGWGSACSNGACTCASNADCTNGRAPSCVDGGGTKSCACGNGTVCAVDERCTGETENDTCKVAPGFTCTVNADCASGTCSGGICGKLEDGKPCDGASDCVSDTCVQGVCLAPGACLTAATCPQPANACEVATCTNGQCGFGFVSAGTLAGTQVGGDCHKSQCDGSGNIVTVIDDTDLPNDGNACTDDVCAAGVPSNPPAHAGSACNQDGGTKCDGNGACVQCVEASDCGTNTACKTFTCTSGVCGSNNAGAGTVVANPTVGDCRSDRCDESGNIAANVPDDTDVPFDDNACTNDVCSAGVPSHPPVAAGEACSQNGGTKCDGAGGCVQCVAASDCGTDTACMKFTCTDGVCGTSNVASGHVVANPTKGDCQSDQCDGNGNIISNASDNSDLPADDGNQCTVATCQNGAPGSVPAVAGTPCNQNGGSVCDGSSSCVSCLTEADCPSGGACQVATCSAGACGFVAAGAQTLPAESQTEGDCEVLVCDGTSQSPTQVPAQAGTTCNENGGSVCDEAGSCVSCLSDTDCPTGGACQAATCNAGTCGFAAAGAQTLPAALQTAGDCQVLECDGTSQSPVSNNDDGDVPADDGNQCTTSACSSGAPVQAPADAGTTCNQNGGTSCDGNGSCIATGPGVVGTTPADGATAIARTTIAVTFTEAMNPATLTGQTTAGDCAGSIQVSLDDFGSCIALSAAAPEMSADKKVATFTARPGLLVNRTYKVRVTTVATSATNGALPAEYTSPTGFTTTTAGHLDGSVVISEVFGGGQSNGATYKSDYVVLHNRGNTEVKLSGLSLQYASAKGTSWSATPAVLSGTISGGGYFLVQLGTGNGNNALSDPDLTMTGGAAFGLSATDGKIALVNGTTSLAAGACPDASRVVDFVAFGATNCSEGSSTGASSVGVLSTTTAAVRANSGCTDTNNNKGDFSVGSPSPRNSASPKAICEITQNESDSALEADYCTTRSPLSINTSKGTAQTIFGQIRKAGVTEAAGANASVLAQVGYGPMTSNPQYESGWTWINATYSAQYGDNDEYQATFPAPAASTYGYLYRFSLDNGASWTYCDKDEDDEPGTGAGVGPDYTFNLDDVPLMSVTP